MSNQKELEKHFERNEKMWKIWEQRGVNSETNLRVFFHFYATNKEDLNSLCQELEEYNIVYKKKEVRTFIFFKGWKVDAEITQKWSLPLLQGKMGRFFLMAQQTGVSLEGCGAIMPTKQ